MIEENQSTNDFVVSRFFCGLLQVVGWIICLILSLAALSDYNSTIDRPIFLLGRAVFFGVFVGGANHVLWAVALAVFKISNRPNGTLNIKPPVISHKITNDEICDQSRLQTSKGQVSVSANAQTGFRPPVDQVSDSPLKIDSQRIAKLESRNR